MGQFEYQAARDCLEQLVRAHPEDLDLQVDLAIATLNRQQEGDEPAALSMAAAVLAKQPDHLRARYVSGLLLLHSGQLAEASLDFSRVAEADPEDAYAAYHLALTLAQLSRFEQALPWYRRAIAADPYLRSGYYGAFQTLRQLRLADEAREMLEIYQKLATNPRARQAEFKYTRMGPKAEVRRLDSGPAKPASPPSGPVFAEAQTLLAAPSQSSADEVAAARASLSAADIDADGRLDLFATGVSPAKGSPNAVLLQAEKGAFELQAGHPLAAIAGVNAALWGDIDNDGLLDAYLCRKGPNQLWRQTEPGKWQDITAETATGNGGLDTVDGALFDADHDGDLDIFLVNRDGPDELLNNNRNGSFTPLAAERGLAGPGAGSRQVLITDLDMDRDADLIVIRDQPPHEVYRNDLLWSYGPAPGFDALREAPIAALLAEDMDADGRPELYALGPDGQAARWSAAADGTWRPTPLQADRPLSVGKHADSSPSIAMALVDVDGDGRSELIASTQAGWAAYRFEGDRLKTLQSAKSQGLRHAIPFQADALAGPSLVAIRGDRGLDVWRPGPGRLGFLSLAFSGMEEQGKSMRSNASGIGTRVGVRVGSRWGVQESFRSYSGPGQSLQPTVVGLGGAKRADYIAIDWSDGVFQSELDLEQGRVHRITETQRQLSSCPVLFVWDGNGYRFVSDFLGVGGVGYAVGPGEYAEPRPWENFQLPEGLAAPRDGRYRLKLMEPMEEAAYLDAVRLVAYDLPPGWQMVLDERMSISGPEPTGRPRYFREIRTPVSVVDQDGVDVTADLLQADLRAAPPGPLDERFIGRLRGSHELVLSLEQPIDQGLGEAMLVIDGWVEYPYSQTMFAAWQAGATYQAPSIDAWSESAGWQPLLEEFGYPAGMPRRLSVPLSGLPQGTTRLRIRTNMEVYWDRIVLAYEETPIEPVRRRELSLAKARLDVTGFPLRITAAQRIPQYDYRRRSPLWDTRHQSGFYTEIGPVEPLVSSIDDALAIIGPGEEIHLEFAAPDALPDPGWTRVLVMETNGWAKDMDLFTQYGDTLEPLPSSGKPVEQRDLLHASYNTRYRAGR